VGKTSHLVAQQVALGHAGHGARVHVQVRAADGGGRDLQDGVLLQGENIFCDRLYDTVGKMVCMCATPLRLAVLSALPWRLRSHACQLEVRLLAT
jgi:hypothetical protein